MQSDRLTAAVTAFLQLAAFSLFLNITVCTEISYLNDADALLSLEAAKHQLCWTDHFTLIKSLMPNSVNYFFIIYLYSFIRWSNSDKNKLPTPTSY